MKNITLTLINIITVDNTTAIQSKHISFLFLIFVIAIFVYVFSNSKEK